MGFKEGDAARAMRLGETRAAAARRELIQSAREFNLNLT